MIFTLRPPALFFALMLAVFTQQSATATAVIERASSPDEANSYSGGQHSVQRPPATYVAALNKDYPAIKPEMVSLASGSFRMGCISGIGCSDKEKPVHSVNVVAFELGKYEVTFDQWRPCVNQGVCRNPSDQGWGRGDRPVIHVSWNDVQTYITWLNQETGDSYRLPTEAEWEYAARAGSSTSYSTGKCITSEQANFDGNYPFEGGGCSQTGPYLKKTAPVGSYAANPWGLYDMHGNVWEWVGDCWNNSYRGAPSNGEIWVDGQCGLRVLRGGSWNYFALILRTAYRLYLSPEIRYNNNGFRLARSGQ